MHSLVQQAIKTLSKHVYFIKNTFDYYNLSNRSLESINNKIKLIKRTLFGIGVTIICIIEYYYFQNLRSKEYKEVKQCLIT